MIKYYKYNINIAHMQGLVSIRSSKFLIVHCNFVEILKGARTPL